MQHAMQLYQGATFFLIPMEGMNGFYEKFGFQITGVKIHRFYTNAIKKCALDKAYTATHTVKVVESNHCSDVLAFAIQCYGKETGGLFQTMLNDQGLVWLSVSSDQGLQGIIAYKQTREKVKISAFCATSLDIARALLCKCVTVSTEGSQFKIGFPSFNQTNCVELYKEILESGTEWQTTEDVMATNGYMPTPSNWEQLFGIFHCCLVCSNWP